MQFNTEIQYQQIKKIEVNKSFLVNKSNLFLVLPYFFFLFGPTQLPTARTTVAACRRRSGCRAPCRALDNSWRAAGFFLDCPASYNGTNDKKHLYLIKTC